MTRTFNKIGKIVAIVSGIVLMGAIFSGCGFFDSMMGGDSTSAQSSSTTSSENKKSDSGVVSSFLGGLFGGSEKESVKREKCSGSGEVELQQTREVFNGRRIVYEKYKEKGTCKSGVKEGVWKSYDSTGYIVLRESTYKKGILDGITKIYNRDETLIEETHYKDGIRKTSTLYAEMLDEEGDFGKKSDKAIKNYYDDGTENINRFYRNGIIAYLIYRQIQEKNIVIARSYSIIDIFAKENGLEQIYLPKLKAKYEKAINDAMKKDGTANKFAIECASAVSEVENYNKGKTRIHPSAQTIKMAQDCQNSPEYWAGAFNFVGSLTGEFDTTSTGKVQAQMQADYETYVISEIKKHSAKFTKDEDILAYVKNKQPFAEIITVGGLRIITKPYRQDGIITTFASLNNQKIIGNLYHNRNTQNACVAENGGNCRAFSRQFKELIDKSAFKDKIYNLLPKPKNQ